MGIKCGTFVSKLSKLLAIKRDLPKSTVASWVRTKISFTLIRSMLICLRGSRSIKSSTMAINDIEVQEILTKNQMEDQIKHLDTSFLSLKKTKIVHIYIHIYIYIYIYIYK